MGRTALKGMYHGNTSDLQRVASDGDWGESMANAALKGMYHGNTSDLHRVASDGDWGKGMSGRALQGMSPSSKVQQNWGAGELSNDDIVAYQRSAAGLVFDAADANNDGKLSLDEIKAY